MSAVINGVQTFYLIKQVWNDTINKNGSLYITKAYLNNSNGSVIVDNIDNLDNKQLVEAKSVMMSEKSLMLTIDTELDDPIDYDRIYFCNDNDDILHCVTIEKKENQTNIYEKYLVRFNETDTIIME